MTQQNEKSTTTVITESQQKQAPHSVSVAQQVVELLEQMGVKLAFGVSGGAIASVWAALEKSSIIEVLHFRHEAGAAFAACEASLAENRPVAVFTTTGPGITNTLTGLFAARWEGAKVIFLSPYTSVSQRGRWAFQETSSHTIPEGMLTSATLFHYATIVESAEQLTLVARRLTAGLFQPGGFVVNLSLPVAVQSHSCKTPLPKEYFHCTQAVASDADVATCAKLLSEGPFAIWVGFEARSAATSIQLLAEKTGAAVMCSPRGKGIFPEDHPQFIGVTGFGGHRSVFNYMQEFCPVRTLVLGNRLGEFTSFWSRTLIPKRGFVHVDSDKNVLGVVYPDVETYGVVSEIQAFVEKLISHLPDGSAITFPRPESDFLEVSENQVRPSFLMQEIQKVIVEGTKAVVMTEAGNSFAWGTHCLRFQEPGRYRVSTSFGSMGHAVTGILGAALVCGKAVGIVGDGAMLMNGGEISTAVKYKIPVVWIILNDGRYNMVAQGAAQQGFQGVDTMMPSVDFVKFAQAMGADGVRVKSEIEVFQALVQAMSSPGPFVVDVAIDPSVKSPISSRIESLIVQGSIQLKGGYVK